MSGAPRLSPELYAELRVIARRVHADHPAKLIQPTELLHEAWLKLDGARAEYRERRHFIATAALAMRQILVDRAREDGANKRGGGVIHTTLSGLAESDWQFGVLEIEAAAARLERIDALTAEVFLARALGGLTLEDTAEALGISRATVARKWRFARAFMAEALGGPRR